MIVILNKNYKIIELNGDWNIFLIYISFVVKIKDN